MWAAVVIVKKVRSGPMFVQTSVRMKCPCQCHTFTMLMFVNFIQIAVRMREIIYA